MKIRTNLSKEWMISGTCGVKGSAFYQNRWIFAHEIMELLEKTSSLNQLDELLSELNGSFSFYFKRDEFLVFGVDQMRSIPLLFSQRNGELELTDQADKLWGNEPLNEEQLQWIEQQYFTESNETIYQDYKALNAGEYALYTSQNLKIVDYFYQNWKYEHRDFSSIKAIYQETFERLYQYVGNRNPVLSLSSGYDSRLILAKLLDFYPAEKIECFSYGNSKFYDVRQSAALCKKLGVKWRFIEYSSSLMKNEMDGRFHQYMKENNHGTSLPCEQNYFAAAEINDKEIYSIENSVFLNGTIGNELGWNVPIKKVQTLFDLHRNKFPEMEETDFYAHFFNQWFKRKLSKFVYNSVKAHTFFGLDLYVPFMDKELIAFWMKTSVEQKVDEKIYAKYVTEELKAKNIFFKSNELSLAYKAVRKLKPYVPFLHYHYSDDLKPMIISKLEREQTQKLNKDISINKILALYFTQELKKEYSKKQDFA